MAALETFTRNEWRFEANNQTLLVRDMSSADSQLFPCDVTAVDWKLFFRQLVLGIRLYLLKEEPSTLPEAQKRLKR